MIESGQAIPNRIDNRELNQVTISLKRESLLNVGRHSLAESFNDKHRRNTPELDSVNLVEIEYRASTQDPEAGVEKSPILGLSDGQQQEASNAKMEETDIHSGQAHGGTGKVRSNEKIIANNGWDGLTELDLNNLFESQTQVDVSKENKPISERVDEKNTLNENAGSDSQEIKKAEVAPTPHPKPGIEQSPSLGLSGGQQQKANNPKMEEADIHSSQAHGGTGEVRSNEKSRANNGWDELTELDLNNLFKSKTQVDVLKENETISERAGERITINENSNEEPDTRDEKPVPVFNRTLDLWDEFKENDWLDASEIHSEIDKFFEDYEPADSALIGPVRSSVHASLDKLLVQRMPSSTGKPGSLTTEFGSFLFRDEEFIKAWGDFRELPALTIKKDLQKKKIILEKGKANLNEWFKTMVAEIKESHKQKEYSNKMKYMLSPVFDKIPEEYSLKFKNEVKDLLVNEIIEDQSQSKVTTFFTIIKFCENFKLSIMKNDVLKKEIILLACKDLELKPKSKMSQLDQFEFDKKQVVENLVKFLQEGLLGLYIRNKSLDPDSI